MANKGSFGGSVKLTGETEYKRALKEITDNLTVLSSEMKVVTSSFSKNEDSVSSLNEKNNILNKKLEEQNKALSEAKKMLDEAKSSTDSNATTIKKWQTELNKAQAEVNKTSKEIEDNEKTLDALEKANVSNTKELKNFEKAEEDAGKSSLTLGDIIKANLISDVIKGGFNMLVDSVKKFSHALNECIDVYQNVEEQEQKFRTAIQNTTDATEEDVQAYVRLAAEKEKHGVVSKAAILNGYQELATYTTQKESIEALTDAMLDMTVQQYGMNATEEQTLSIATRLGKALSNGDYSGLAKMGYYFSDAEKQAMKFGTEEDRVNALLEAITGSVGGMNEALAQTNAGKVKIASSYIDDMKESVGNLASDMKNNLISEFLPSIEQMSTALSEMVTGDLSIDEGIQKITDGVLVGLDTITQMLPNVLETGLNIVGKLIEGIVQAIPNMMPAITQLVMTLISNLVASLPNILQTGITILLELVNGITQALPELIPVAIQAIMALVNTMLDNIDEIIECGIQLLVALTEGIMNALPELISRLPEIIIKLTSKLIELAPQLLSAALRIMAALGEGLIKFIPEIISRIPQIIKSMVNAFKERFGDFKSIGTNLLKGLWEGMGNTVQWLKDKIKSMVGDVTKFIKKLFGIHSPSTVFRDEIGTNLALGIGEGFDDTMKDVSRNMADAIPTDFGAISSSDVNGILFSSQPGNNYDYSLMVNAFKEALSEMKIELDDEVAGNFVEKAVEKVVYQ